MLSLKKRKISTIKKKKGLLNILTTWIFTPGYPKKRYTNPFRKNRKSFLMHIMHSNIPLKKRVSLFPPFHKVKASITVEASIVLPLFLIFCVQMISFIEVFRVHSMVEAALHQEVSKISLYAYAYEENVPEKMELLKGILEDEYILEKVKERIGKRNLDQSMIKEGSRGITISLLTKSKKRQQDVIDIALQYKIVPAIRLLGFEEFELVNHCLMKKWNGYQPELICKEGKEDEEMVFITDYGTVFHRSEDCTHIHLSISYVDRDLVNSLRNSGGAKYYPCEYCGKTKESTVIITKEGDRYHNRIDCSGLKRLIHEVPISEVGGRMPCSRCYH